MKNKKVLTLAMLAGLTLGGLSVASAASAQSYGGDSDSSATEESTVEETTSVEDGTIVEIQSDADGTDEAEAEDGDTADTDTTGERSGRRGHRGGCDLDDAAAAIGIDETDLRAALDDGDTIADVAEANGVDVDSVIDALVDAKADRLAEKVADGSITQAEGDEKLADAEDRITDRVNGVEVDRSERGEVVPDA